MQRQFPEYLAIFLAVIAYGPAIWADDKPKVAKTDTSDIKKDESRLAVPEATAGEINVSWNGGQLTFPETSSKESGLKLRCTGNVMIEGKGLTAKANNLDLTIAGNAVVPKAPDVNLRCAGSVMIEWKGITAMAADLQYNAEKEVLLLSSGGRPNGCVLRSKNKDGTNAVLIADQISLSPSSSKVSCVGVKEYKVVEATTPTVPTASSNPYAPPGSYIPAPAGYTYVPVTVPSGTVYPASGPSGEPSLPARR